MIATAIIAMMLCTPAGYCTFPDGTMQPSEYYEYSNEISCKTAAGIQTRKFESGGSHGYYARCVTKEVPTWAPID